MPAHENPYRYRDLYFRIIISLVAAHIIVTFGANESVFLLLISWFYYRDLFLSFIIAFLLVNAVYLPTVILDKRYDWRQHTAARIGLQLLFGLILPGIAAFILAAGYFAIFGISILDTLYLKFDLPIIMIMLLALNIYYLAFYFYRQWQLSEKKMSESTGDNTKEKGIFIVQKGTKIIPLPVETISYFYHDGDYNFVRTVDKEDFLITRPLDDIQQQVSEKLFFRVNRQTLVNFTACQHFEPLDFGKLRLFVVPPLKEPIIISRKRAKLFKSWMAR